MNFRRKMVYTAVSCILILVTVLFTVISIVGFNSQNASAAPISINKVGIKIKINYDAKTFDEPNKHEGTTKKDIKDKLKKAIEDNTNLEVFEGEHRLEWMIYFLINQEHRELSYFGPKEGLAFINQKQGTAGMSITLTHGGRFVMNHIKAIHIKDPADLGPFIDDMIEVVLNVIQQKMKNKDAAIIITDKSTIAN